MPPFEYSRFAAERILLTTERKLARSPIVQQGNNDYTVEHKRLHHMELYTGTEPSGYLISHHSILYLFYFFVGKSSWIRLRRGAGGRGYIGLQLAKTLRWPIRVLKWPSRSGIDKAYRNPPPPVRGNDLPLPVSRCSGPHRPYG